ncbi:DUF6206 family protein [Pseudoprimorskyibacter insulae]|uniref:Aminoglycoside phosphotransferase domain-containing protein n=1 Tax=Pseudoprimorskyibacter insulae TaxID=1695997 RepID=A0A2R8AQU9_9RHOB|nr:DUF6206 family protein [Pseudoprimorskyibacter insulae]SPF78247.1 hypothetical protein PRI8871_00840 [Pseudoprimorskyibacter insulae]
MTDLDALRDLLREDSPYRTAPVSRLGYFCAPFRPSGGPLADKIIKIYRGLPDNAALDRLAQCHDDYVAALVKTGVPMPLTEIHLMDMGGARIPVIVQEALPDGTMMRPLMQSASLAETLDMMQAAGEVIATFWNNADQFDTRIGFHPSIRNFAIVDGGAVFFDSFPPLIHYTRDEVGKMLLQYSDKRLMRLVGPFLQKKVTGIQDEWYSAPETLVGLVGSACRLRPDDAEAYLDWGRGFAKSAMPRWADEAIAGMIEAPRLPSYWTGFRKVLGLQGEPNLKK